MPTSDDIFRESFVNFKTSREHQKLFINSREVVGVQNAQLESNAPLSPVLHMGMSGVHTILSSQPVGNIGIQSLLVNEDRFIEFTGTAPLTGYFVNTVNTNKNQLNLIFAPTYLTSYALKYSDGSVPEVSASFVTFTAIGTMDYNDMSTFDVNTAIQTGVPNYSLKIPNRSSITLNVDEFTTNRLSSIDITITVPRRPYYSIGSIVPFDVRINSPLVITANFQFEFGNYQFRNLRTAIRQKTSKNVSLVVNDYLSNASIASYAFDKMELVGESFSSNVAGNLVGTLQFKGYHGF